MPEEKNYWINKINATAKLGISAVVAIVVYLLHPLDPALQLIFSWDVFSFVLLSLLWFTFFTTSTQAIRAESQKEDGSRIVIFIVVILATILSMFAVLQIVISSPEHTENKILNLVCGIACMIFSWSLVQTIFASRYAHLYYAKDKGGQSSERGGLDFPGKTKPDFIDFAYFAFTIGMTFQVSDVEISDRRIRRIALLHSMLSFAFNACVISLSVNIISGLASK